MYFLWKLNFALINFHFNMESNCVGFQGHLSDSVIVLNYSHYGIILTIDVKDIVLFVDKAG